MWRTMRRAIFGSMVSISSLVKRSPALIDPMKPLIIKTFCSCSATFSCNFLAVSINLSIIILFRMLCNKDFKIHELC
eukprot:XP_001704166.1 Hypothetical protein GL50803_39741 [Giardia lamblia ATCC 50803]